MKDRKPFRRATPALALAVLLALAGCGSDVFEGEESVPLEKLPAPVMETARKALPGVTFTKAFKGKLDGGAQGYEIQGKAKDGKVREAEVGLDGKLIAIE
jgi:hypothetical protein